MRAGLRERDPQRAGWEALARGEWAAARASFEEVLTARESPEALEGLGWVGYFLDDALLTFEAREEAYRLYRQRGDESAAARVAAWLAADCLEFRGETAVANGWLRRAHRLLDGKDRVADHGWLAVHEASMIIGDEPRRAAELAGEAVALGRRFDVPELEMVGLGLQGLALVSQGRLDEGMRLLDEASAAALAGEAELLLCAGWACCYLIAACEQVRDYDRAAQWCERVTAFSARYGINILLGVCRAKYAGVLAWRGRWDHAEQELAVAVDGLAASRPGLLGEALVRLAELRRRQGRLDEAEQLFDRCEGSPSAVLGRATMALDRDQPQEAADLAERYLRRYPERDRIERCAGLEVAVGAFIRLGEHDRARDALEQLAGIAARIGTPLLRGAVLALEGSLAAHLGDHPSARCRYEDALDLLAGADAPFETARVRLDLARTLRALERHEAARREARRALRAFERLGAALEAARARELLGGLADTDTRSGGATDGPLGRLSKRELEVLQLVAEGLSNAEIAEALVLSGHTVHRHVANILRKLNVPSRAAAASLAARHGFV